MTSFSKFWDAIFVINRDCRIDRLAHAVTQAASHGFFWNRVSAHEDVDRNAGCTNSHRGVLEIIAHGGFQEGWKRCLVLEDDFEIIEPDSAKEWQHDAESGRTHPFNDMWDIIEPEIPPDFDLLYLGGSYAEPPQARVSKHIIRVNRMMTTSSFGITPAYARKLAPHIYGHGPIDTLVGGFNAANKCYCVQPRLMVQYTNPSDLQGGREMDNSVSMCDPRYELTI